MSGAVGRFEPGRSHQEVDRMRRSDVATLRMPIADPVARGTEGPGSCAASSVVAKGDLEQLSPLGCGEGFCRLV